MIYILAANEQSTGDKTSFKQDFFNKYIFNNSRTANFPSEPSRTRRVDPAGRGHQMSAQRTNLLFQNDFFFFYIQDLF